MVTMKVAAAMVSHPNPVSRQTSGDLARTRCKGDRGGGATRSLVRGRKAQGKRLMRRVPATFYGWGGGASWRRNRGRGAIWLGHHVEGKWGGPPTRLAGGGGRHRPTASGHGWHGKHGCSG
jgi:hypothetical protein